MSRKWDRRITWAMTIVFLAIAIPWFVALVPDAAGVVGPRAAVHDPHGPEGDRSAWPSSRSLGATLIGIALGTLITIRFKPLQWLDPRLHRGLARTPDHRHDLPHLLRVPAVDETFSLPFAINPLEAFLAATVGLILWGSAQVAEATRGAIQSIPREQHEAAAPLGFGWIGTHAFVIVPQAVRRLLPPLVGLLVNIVQNTTIAGLIGVGDVLETGNRSTERLLFSTGDAHYLQISLAVLVFFFALSYPLTRLAALLEKRRAV